jgi:hypothetical protein
MSRSIRLLVLAALVAASTAPGAVARGAGASPLDGTWKWTWTPDELRRVGIKNAPTLVGSWTATFANGHHTDRNLTSGRIYTGARFFVRGKVVGIVFPRPGPGIVPGRTYELRWSIYRDRLSFSELPGRSVLTAMLIKPWIRVR